MTTKALLKNSMISVAYVRPSEPQKIILTTKGSVYFPKVFIKSVTHCF